MDNLQRYRDYVRPVIEAINKHHNEFCQLDHFKIKPQDLFLDGSSDEGLTDFRSQE